MNRLIFSCCDGKVSDMKALEWSNYWDYCAIIDNYLVKVEETKAAIDKYNRENNITSKGGKKTRSSKK